MENNEEKIKEMESEIANVSSIVESERIKLGSVTEIVESIVKIMNRYDRALDSTDNDIRRLSDAIIQLQAKVNTIEHRLNEEIKEREISEENIRDDIDTHGRMIRKLTDDVIRIEDMVSEARERIGDLEDDMMDIEERVKDMESDIEYVKDNMMEGEDTYNPPDDYIF